jgi:hypothetical protein
MVEVNEDARKEALQFCNCCESYITQKEKNKPKIHPQITKCKD